jgi:ligand-binding sensor domain-containing protein
VKTGRLIFFCAFGILVNLCAAQEKFLRHYSVAEGLPSSETYAVFQDSRGFIWVASDMGVGRFDGYNFKVFTTANGLTDNTIFKFYEDDKGRIWFNTYSGRLCYYYNDSIYSKELAVNDKLRTFLGPGILNGLRVDKDDTILLSTNKGLIKVIPSIENNKRVWNRLEALNNKMTVLVDGGFVTFDRSFIANINWYNGGKNIRASLSNPTSNITLVERARNQSLLLFFLETIQVVDTFAHLAKDRPIPFNIDNPISYATHILQETDTTFWLGLKGGGVRLCSLDNPLKPIRKLLGSLSVTWIMKDREGGYWFTTLEDGLFYMPNDAVRLYAATDESVINNKLTFHIMGDGKIWALSSFELYERKGKAGEFIPILPGLLKTYVFPDRWNSYWNLFVHSDGNFWISTNAGVVVLNNRTHNIINRTFASKTADFPARSSRLLIEDRAGDVWSLNQNILLKIDHHSFKLLQTITLPSRAETMCEDYDGSILIGALDGLYRLVKDSVSYLGLKNKLFTNRIVDLKKHGGNIYAASRGVGVFIISGDSVQQITVANGLRSNMCRSIFIDEQNTIWVGTNNGLSAIRHSEVPSKASILSFSSADGLPSDDISHVEKDGSLIWLLTKKGICSFYPEVLARKSIPPPVYITRLRIDNMPQPLNGSHELSSKINFIGLDYVGLTYKNAGRQNYKYKLEGYDTSWTYTRNTFVQFTKLPAGSYKFIVSCINNLGVESTQPAVYTFTVNAPFYKRWWFYISLSLAFAGVVIISSMLTVQRIRKREKTKTEINRKIANLELQALRAQMNPHFIFNCLNAIQDFILKNEPIPAKHYLSSFSKLIRKTLDNSRRQNISLTDEIDFLYLYLELERMRANSRFEFEITLEEGVKDMNLEIPSMILQPFIENAVRHSKIGSLPGQGSLKINFSVREDNLVCIIDDNGVGVNITLKAKAAEARRGNAHATDIINDRVRTINEVHDMNIKYTITDKSDVGSAETGTRVEVIIPMQTMY